MTREEANREEWERPRPPVFFTWDYHRDLIKKAHHKVRKAHHHVRKALGAAPKEA